jgi:hypothetical protein
MKFEWPWKKRKLKLEKDLGMVEKRLENLYQPVTPRAEFIKNLRAELVGKPEQNKWAFLSGNWRKGLLVASGVFSFFAMVMGGIRIVIAILGLVKVNKQRTLEEPVSA